ncbi:MAG: hypothetical protein ACI8ZN_000058 [Bacteroidia bacterium]|jgi:hypothetical protein
MGRFVVRARFIVVTIINEPKCIGANLQLPATFNHQRFELYQREVFVIIAVKLVDCLATYLHATNQ